MRPSDGKSGPRIGVIALEFELAPIPLGHMEGLKNLGLIARQQSLQPGEVRLGQVTANLAMSIRSSAPDEDVSCHRIDVDPGFVRRILSPGQSGCAALHEHP